MSLMPRESFICAEIESLAKEINTLEGSITWAEGQREKIIKEAKSLNPPVPGIFTPQWVRDLKFIKDKIISLLQYMENIETGPR